MRVIASVEELKSLVGQEVAVSDWMEVTQERVNLFAQATGDHQWIHLDVERCCKESPYGGTIAHGFLTLSLLPMPPPARDQPKPRPWPTRACHW